MTTQQNNSATFDIPGTHSKVKLEVCDIFEKTGPKVIHCHHTFDTDPLVMKEYSVMGQFVQLCEENEVGIDEYIEEWVNKNESKSAYMESLPCRKHIFELGEIIHIDVAGETYLLTAFEDLVQIQETGAMEIDSYISFLDNFWASCGKARIDRTTLNITTFGNKIVNISNNGFTIDQKLGLILQSYFKATKEYRLFDTLRICIHETDAPKLDLSAWETAVIPHLYLFSQLPIGIRSSSNKQKGLFAGIRKGLDYYRVCSTSENAIERKKVFISHSKNDCDQAELVYDYLESQGLECWIDVRDITPGIPYAKEIMNGFNSSDAVVVILSKNAMYSVGVLNEIDNVYKKNKIIIPFRIDESELSDEMSFYLSSTQWINAYPKFEDHFEELKLALDQLLTIK